LAGLRPASNNLAKLTAVTVFASLRLGEKTFTSNKKLISRKGAKNAKENLEPQFLFRLRETNSVTADRLTFAPLPTISPRTVTTGF
jgi:hypothetical protein